MVDRTLLSAEAVRPTAARAYKSAAIALDAQTAALRIRIPTPTGTNGVTWSGKASVAIVVEVDGQQQRATFQVTGGVRMRRDGTPRDAFSAVWNLPTGFFGAGEGVAEADWDSVPFLRLGETAKAQYRAWVEVTRISGSISSTVELTATVEPAPPAPAFHHSIAYDTASSVIEDDGGDGSVSLSFTAGAGSDRVAFVWCSSDRDNVQTTHTVTYGGNSPTITRPINVANSFMRLTADIFLDSQIGSGAKTIAFAASGGSGAGFGGHSIGVMTASGVDQTTPAGTGQQIASNTAANPSRTVTSVNSTDLVVDGGAFYGPVTMTVGAGQTARVNAVTGNNNLFGSTQLGSAGGAMTWTRSGGAEYAFGAVALKQSTATGATGTAALTLPKLVASATGTMLPTGTAALTLPKLVASATGTQTNTGTASLTLPKLVASATGAMQPSGTAALVLPALVASASGTQTISGTAALTLPALAASASGAQTATGTAALTLPAIIASATGTHTGPPTGTADLVLPKLTASASGTQTVTGTAALTLPAITASATGYMQPTGSAALTLPALQVSASGTASPSAGTADLVLPALIASATGSQTITATAALTLPSVVVSASGTQTVAGSAALTLPALQASATGVHGTDTVGSAALVLPKLVVSATGSAPITGTASLSLPSLTASASGSQTATGISAITLPALQVSASGAQTLSGTAALVLPHIVASATGTQSITGSAALTLRSLVIDATGTHVAQVTGTAAVGLPALRVAATGLVAAPAGTIVYLMGSALVLPLLDARAFTATLLEARALTTTA